VRRRFILALTGASGQGYALSLADKLSSVENAEFRLIVSANAERVLERETGLDPAALAGRLGARGAPVSLDGIHDMFAPPASGSYRWEAMAVVPCSMGSLADIANGSSRNLIGRAADVGLKEGRRLVLVPRETPYSLVHLRNMVSLAEAGAVILPASPGFYGRPGTIEECYAFVADRILARMGLEPEGPEWGTE
jgi:4-hydroxy-3-polyprenylbenzoate decarboxylase